MSPVSTVNRATLLMLQKSQLSLAAFVLVETIVSTVGLPTFTAQ
jgi:hypothetical protein